MFSDRTIREYQEEYAPARVALDSWLQRASDAAWQNPAQITQDFGINVRTLPRRRLIFKICQNRYRLCVQVAYPRTPEEEGLLFIKWFGPHGDYDRLGERVWER